MSDFKQIAKEVRESIRTLDDQLVSFALEVAETQVRGVEVTPFPAADILHTTNCFLQGNCGCFYGMVTDLLSAVEDEAAKLPNTAADQEGKAAFDKMLASVVTNRVQ